VGAFASQGGSVRETRRTAQPTPASTRPVSCSSTLKDTCAESLVRAGFAGAAFWPLSFASAAPPHRARDENFLPPSGPLTLGNKFPSLPRLWSLCDHCRALFTATGDRRPPPPGQQATTLERRPGPSPSLRSFASRPGAATSTRPGRFQDPDLLICPVCGEKAYPEPPVFWAISDGAARTSPRGPLCPLPKPRGPAGERATEPVPAPRAGETGDGVRGSLGCAPGWLRHRRCHWGTLAHGWRGRLDD
jgi:hypothetical protein